MAAVSIVDYRHHAGFRWPPDQIDSTQFTEEMDENPDGLTSIFVGDDSMVAQMDDLMDTYLDSSNGIITMRPAKHH